METLFLIVSRFFKMATATDTRGNVVKMDVDFSSTVDELIPNCEALVKVRTGLMRG
jgi:hypothetical protein